MPAILPDRTLNTLLKDVVLKSFIVIYESQSPTHNKEAAIEKMLEAGQFIAIHGVNMTQDWFDNLGNRSAEQGLIVIQCTLSTRWCDLFTSPLRTYKTARDFKAGADLFLSDAKTASAQADFNLSSELWEEKKAKKAALQANTIQPVPTAEGAVTVLSHPANVTTPAPFLSTLAPHTDLDTGADDCAYIRLRGVEMKVPLDSRTQIHFDGEVLTTTFRAGLVNNYISASDDQRVGAVKRSASVFTATGTARIVPQEDAVGGVPNQNHLEEGSITCKLEWLEGPIVTALTELEDRLEPETMESVLDSDP